MSETKGRPESSAATQSAWGSLIPEEEWQVYQEALEIARQANVPFLLGGAFGLASYTGRWRNTKDMDLYIHPDDREKMIQSLTAAGFHDFYDDLPYDRAWIYRSVRDGVIVDLIWAMANQRAQVDETWFQAGRPLELRGEQAMALAPEELIWCKLYVLQRDRCDWPDIFNILYAAGASLDWNRLFRRVGADAPLLLAALGVFGWLCPGRLAQFPKSVQDRLASFGKSGTEEHRLDALRWLDSRPWFAALQPADAALKL